MACTVIEQSPQGRAPTEQHIKQVCMRVMQGKTAFMLYLSLISYMYYETLL